jgi:transposase
VQQYSESFKRKMVQRLLLPNGPTGMALAREVGVSQPTLSRWLRSLGSVVSVTTKSTPGAASGSRRPEDWSAQERLRAVMEASKLGDAELGEFLRREGLHEETLAQWRDAVMEALQPTQSPSARGGDKKRIKQLEREVLRKDKALAEAAALLILKKKAQAIWGGEADDMDEENEK